MNPFVETAFESLQDIFAGFIESIPTILGGLVILFLTGYVAKAARGVAGRLGDRLFRSRSLQSLVQKTSFVTTWALGIILAAVVAAPGLTLGDIIASLSLGTVAIGFAFRNIAENFISGVILLWEEPFRIGDQIVLEGYEGTIQEINLRTTQIRTYQGEQILVPNSMVFTNAVTVRTASPHRRTDLAVGVDYNTALPEAAEILRRTVSEVDGVLAEPPLAVDLVNFGDSSIDFVIRYWTASEQRSVLDAQTRALIAIKKALDAAEIGIPYPIRTLYFFNQDGYNDDQPKH
ncbi:MAG: mechanosensitive ion channel family protein [Spirulinaceae cyanobacterium RM2_2_10]|nr:mechanosensitive ion channel family protein [Spirulinaceae cyanobacterium SM2_1_0]NJO21015.1 mechanosensitive ion channel family protein [Spirulinaceae cyanobacterium RM2_2_10]